MRAIVLTFDRLPIHRLGCYGNLRVDTPNFNRLATESITFDSHFAEDLSFDTICRAWWMGNYSFPRPALNAPLGSTLPASLRKHGVEVRLIQETESDGIPLEDFSAVTTLEAEDRPVEDDSATRFGRLIDEAVRQLAELGQTNSWLLWLHSPGVASQYPSASAELRGSTATESVTALDSGLGKLLAALNNLPSEQGDNTLFVVTAAQGDVPPSSASLRWESARLAEPLVRTPLFARLPSENMGCRQRTFVQTVDLAPSLLEWFEAPADSMPCEGRSWLSVVDGSRDVEDRRSYVCYGDGEGAAAIRTEDLCVVVDDLDAAAAEGHPGVRLFVKPDDFWEVDDALVQFPEQASGLLATLEQFVENAQQTSPMLIPELASSGQSSA